jgi:hypothetical protein
MKASEFIEKLTELVERYGDLPVRLTEDPVPGCSCEAVFQNRNDGSPLHFEIR